MDLLAISGAHGSLDKPIVDRTGLIGSVDIDIEFIPAEAVERGIPALGLPFTEAIVDQLGLRLERAEEPSAVLAIDSVTLPSLD